MRARILTIAAVTLLGGLAMSQSSKRLNPVIDLLKNKQPVFGLYAPANSGGGRGRGAAPDAPPVAAPPPKTGAQLAQEALAYAPADLIFNGNMEGGRGFAASRDRFAEFAKGMLDGGGVRKNPTQLSHPLFVKTPKIAPDTAMAREYITAQLNLGVSGIVFVGVESADEVKAGLAMMRFKSKGGTRPDTVGDAPAFWGMNEKDYKAKADLWPLNSSGELVNWTIVESKEGLAHVREIAAVKGIGALFPGAGTLRGVMTRDSAGRAVRDSAAWEGAIQQVLSACKEFKVACGYPATENDIEMRMKQGFSVFIINWGAAGFRAVELGRKVAGR